MDAVVMESGVITELPSFPTWTPGWIVVTFTAIGTWGEEQVWGR